MAGDDALRAMAGSVEAVLGAPEGWEAPDGYRSVGLATIDAVWSIGVRFEGVRNVVSRYRAERDAAGAIPRPGDRGSGRPRRGRRAAPRAAEGPVGDRARAGLRRAWHAFAMLVGLDDVKPDRMVRRFVAGALGRATVSAEDARALVIETAIGFGVSPRALDYAIWSHVSHR